MIMLSIIGGGTLAVLLLIMFFVGYFKAPTNKCFVISGLRKHARTVIGKAGFRFPFLERKDELTLDLISVDVKTQEAVPTAECINISVDAVANIKIGTSEEALAKAAQHFLNKDARDINATAREVLEGNLREIVGTMSLKAMMNDRKTFAEAVQQNAVPDLDRMGLEIISFNVQNFSDDQGVINNLGIDNIATISKNASIAKANAQKEVAVAEAKAREESNDAKVAADTAIAEKNNALEVRKAELEAERLKQVAKAEAAGAIEKETQRKTIEITKQNAEIARLEKETELKEQEISIKEKALDAEIKKQADAEKYAAQTRADAELYERTKAAEAEKIERERTAEANLISLQKKAEAEKYEQEKAAEALIAKSEAEKQQKLNEAEGQKALAEAIQAKGEAEAAAIKAKLEAEAEGLKAKGEAEANAILKKAEALAKMNDTGKMDLQLEALKALFSQLPAMYAAAAKPWEKVGNITMYSGGKEGGDSLLTGNITKTITQVGAGLKDSLGIDLGDIVKSLVGGKLVGTEVAKALTPSDKISI